MYIRDGENGYLIPVGDADVMADRMLALMEDKKLGESFSKESVKIREDSQTIESLVCGKRYWFDKFLRNLIKCEIKLDCLCEI